MVTVVPHVPHDLPEIVLRGHLGNSGLLWFRLK